MTAQQSTIKELVISSAARIENRRSQNSRTLNKNKAMKETREIYEAPMMETVEVMVEQGFQMSTPSKSNPDPLKEKIR